MSDINELSKETVQELLQLYKQLKRDSQTTDQFKPIELPKEIHDDIENALSISIKQNLKRFAKATLQYHGGRWTQPEAINAVFKSKLKKHQVEASEMVAAIHKGAEWIRTTARAATEI
ncbi:hypothetical protein PHYBLDRAFT_67468 [Phycomyces blakesleeanus NRRL 1555(-)]|uniref:Uncharacterized protein n=1 Tax=Phycomyces blakesleeanus (strain ATCC 8743b / DSM 1359 / FGSC 10004 / NBRC 33097 / NRRL 1555) TaxID=763407 RepID=A0A162XFX0_PHYB8|nr:hypothetical protein PHYBLDRAFT_67468 [Phycomyces blakesleeanus NRRL 1555(-)]OAD74615.1 hypothetical protein PHYBLDRAFT_67468 [Phycomyces blakesleeanus NRRL 1555(-)]|eukprot:XP_018292655.1 hypothetical protein PHYBLDRAFT_67468 [Phycomyces blakesleeanus NRRL 1555(-)]